MSQELRPGYLANFMATSIILEEMKRKKISKDDLAKLANVTKHAVDHWFANGRHLTVFHAGIIASLIGCELEVSLKRKKKP